MYVELLYSGEKEISSFIENILMCTSHIIITDIVIVDLILTSLSV